MEAYNVVFCISELQSLAIYGRSRQADGLKETLRLQQLELYRRRPAVCIPHASFTSSEAVDRGGTCSYINVRTPMSIRSCRVRRPPARHGLESCHSRPYCRLPPFINRTRRFRS